jgi:hypothetical protein
MNNQIYQTIIRTINSNCKLTRDDIYLIINKDLKNNKEYLDEIKENRPSNGNTKNDDLSLNSDEYILKEDDSAPIKYQTFISIYSNLKRRQMFKTSMWRKLKENSLDFSNQYNEMQSKQIDSIKQYKTARERLNDNIIVKMANQHNLAPILMVRLILEGLIKTNSIELIDVDENNEKKKEKITISQIIRETHLLKDGHLACEIIECCAIDDDYGPIIDSIKNLSGFKYEKKLENILIEKNISFIKESELREKGSLKTSINI